MTTTAVEPTVLETLSQVLNVSVDELKAEPTLAAHDWDSFSSLETLAQLEGKLGLRFDLREFNSAHTVDDLVSLVASLSEVR
jgi:acyl carrier protein